MKTGALGDPSATKARSQARPNSAIGLGIVYKSTATAKHITNKMVQANNSNSNSNKTIT